MLLLKENFTGKTPIYKTELKITKDGSLLRFTFNAEHCSFNSYSSNFNDEIWRGDVCEFYLETSEKNHYLELEIAPNGTMFAVDVCNVNGKRSHVDLTQDGINGYTKRNGSNLVSVIELDLNKFNIPSNPRFNAFRIETDNERSDKHLFALSPTMCDSFHHPEFFVLLNDYLNK